MTAPEEPLPGGVIAEVVGVGDTVRRTPPAAADADRDEPGMRRLRAAGAADGVRSWQEWLLRHRRVVEAARGG